MKKKFKTNMRDKTISRMFSKVSDNLQKGCLEVAISENTSLSDQDKIVTALATISGFFNVSFIVGNSGGGTPEILDCTDPYAQPAHSKYGVEL